jgi:hypothetical protein
MESQRSGSYEPGTVTVGDGDRIADRGTTYTTGVRREFGPASSVGENVMTVRNRIQWGPIIAGLATALATFLLLTVLGLALGASVLDPENSAGEIGTWAAVWGAITAIASFLLGGWVAAKTAAVDGPFAGLMNGFLVGAAGLLLLTWLTSTGLGNLFGTLSSNVGDILSVAQDTAQQQGVTPEEAQGEAQQVQDQAAQQVDETVAALDDESTFDNVRDSAFGTFLGLLLPLAAAALGGYLGHNKRRELIEGTG